MTNTKLVCNKSLDTNVLIYYFFENSNYFDVWFFAEFQYFLYITSDVLESRKADEIPIKARYVPQRFTETRRRNNDFFWFKLFAIQERYSRLWILWAVNFLSQGMLENTPIVQKYIYYARNVIKFFCNFFVIFSSCLHKNW